MTSQANHIIAALRAAPRATLAAVETMLDRPDLAEFLAQTARLGPEGVRLLTAVARMLPLERLRQELTVKALVEANLCASSARRVA